MYLLLVLYLQTHKVMLRFDTVNYSTRVSSGFQSRQRTRKLVAEGLKEFNRLHK